VKENKMKIESKGKLEWFDPSLQNSIILNQNINDSSEWKCRLFGIDSFLFIPQKGREPNIFWRTMQYFLLGNKWSRDG